MKLFKTHRKAAVAGIALTVAVFGGGVAFAFFPTTGGGSGNTPIGAGSTVNITQLATTSQSAYNSFSAALPPDTWGLSFGGTNATELGNAITLASSTTALSSVVVALDSQACQSGTGATCLTTPGATFNVPIQLYIYDPTTMNVIASSNQTFTVPYRPSANPAQCSTGNNWSTYPNDGTQWYDAQTNNCYYGVTYAATFTNFTFTGSDILPSNIVYGIAYNATSGPASSLNVEWSNEATDISVGSDTNPGNLFVSAGAASPSNALGGSSGQITCGPVGTSFVSYSTAAGANCGAELPQAVGQIADIPQVQFNVGSVGGGLGALLPGGPAQPIDFSIGNPGSTPAYVQSVTVAITSTPAGCPASWFTLVQPRSPLNASIPAGLTVNFSPSGGSIALINEPYSQAACESGTVGLTFTAN